MSTFARQSSYVMPTKAAVEADLDSSRHGPRCGLTAEEVELSRATHGINVLTPPPRVSLWRLYLAKYSDPIIRILLVAAAISLVLAIFNGEYIETVGIFVAIFLATTIGFVFERDAARKFSILNRMDEDTPVRVRRNGEVCVVPRRDVVVGDVVLVEAGDEVPADGTLLLAHDLQVDESSLTGEPTSEKRVVTTSGAEGCESERSTYPVDMLLRGSMVMGGWGEYAVTAVGDSTEIGHVARSSAEPTAVKTPLNIQLDRLAKLISTLGTIVSVAAFVIFLVHDILTDPVWLTADYLAMSEIVLRYFMMAVTLIVMAVPEGLPMAVTLSLALNMRRMLNNNNLVRKMHACETMGAVTVICTDKTGTLTENRMSVAETMIIDDTCLDEAVALNSTADIGSDGRGIGNPTETALLRWLGQSRGADYAFLRRQTAVVWQLPFSTERKYMATIADIGGRRMLFVKGAPEVILSFCSDATGVGPYGTTEDDGSDVLSALSRYQHGAMRTLAFAYAEYDGAVPPDLLFGARQESGAQLESALIGLRLQAVVAISDPVRSDVPAAVATCRAAGIEVKVVTGDSSATAVEIARQIGIVDDNSPAAAFITGSDFAAMDDDEACLSAGQVKVMSRARPADKQRLVTMLQRRGEVVAVTGDGTNDAPALNHAHVGLSLGSGTSVAKEAGDITLLDDSFGSIVSAVMWGRSLYINLQRFLFFQLTVNVAALLLVLAGSIVGTQMPLTVTQILWVNLIMDTFAAMALASLPPSPEVMNDKPRSRSDFIITRPMWRGIMAVGIGQAVVMFAYLLYCLHAEEGIQLHELSRFFTAFVMLQAWNLLNAKALHTGHSAFRGLRRARGLHVVLLMIVVGQLLIVTFGGRMFRTMPLSVAEWVIIVGATSVVLWVGELYRLIRRN